MSDTHTLSLRSRLRGGAFWAFAKIQSIPPLVTLPAVGLAAWFATPYAIGLAEGRSAAVATTAGAGETDGTTAAPRSDPVAQAPSSASGAPSPVGTAGGASLLARPITASMIPAWLPVTVPAAAAPAAQPAQPRVTAQHAVSQAPRPSKATGRLIDPMPQERSVERHQIARGGFDQRRSAVGMAQGYRNNLTTGRSAAVGNGYVSRGPISGGNRWRVGGSIPRGPISAPASFGGYRGFGIGGFGGMRGGGGYGGYRGGGRR